MVMTADFWKLVKGEPGALSLLEPTERLNLILETFVSGGNSTSSSFLQVGHRVGGSLTFWL